jgi:phosphoglucomutase
MDSEPEETLSKMILTASGWRGVFAESGNEEDSGTDISEAHRIIAAAAAKVFSDYLSVLGWDKTAIIVGRDSRPTGTAIIDAVLRSLLAAGREVWYTGISPVPEIMAFARKNTPGDAGTNSAAGGFVYISASHNPIGHNGIKFGLTDGGVLGTAENAKLLSAFRSFMSSKDHVEETKALLERASEKNLAALYAAAGEIKNKALSAYRDFTAETVSGFKDPSIQKDFFALFRKEFEKRPLGIVADFNGSARTASIDRDFFNSLGIDFCCINDTPGKIVHRIIPEGESLEPCKLFLENKHSKDPSYILGYVCDCDGDRGNLVYWDDKEQQVKIFGAQETFALACVAELSYLVWCGELRYDSKGNAITRTALAVNDPSSLRIDKIAKVFDVSLYRAEVGEANVVGLARKLRGQGFQVRISGEGSSGGTIIYPSSVRDPIDTLCAILKLLAIREGTDPSGMGLFEIWCDRSGQTEKYHNDFTLCDIIISLPVFATTGVTANDAVLKTKTKDQALLKEKYQKIFLRDWDNQKESFSEKYGISGWEAIAYNGMEERRGISGFGDAGQGGLKIEFLGSPELSGEKENKKAFIWMRGSGTEPVFRIMADAESPALERSLIDWQRRMVLEADNT